MSSLSLSLSSRHDIVNQRVHKNKIVKNWVLQNSNSPHRNGSKVWHSNRWLDSNLGPLIYEETALSVNSAIICWHRQSWSTVVIRTQRDQIWRNFATWANFKNLRQTVEGLFFVWQNFKHTLAILMNFGQIWAIVSSQIMKSILPIWSHCPILTIRR